MYLLRGVGTSLNTVKDTPTGEFTIGKLIINIGPLFIISFVHMNCKMQFVSDLKVGFIQHNVYQLRLSTQSNPATQCRFSPSRKWRETSSFSRQGYKDNKLRLDTYQYQMFVTERVQI